MLVNAVLVENGFRRTLSGLDHQRVLEAIKNAAADGPPMWRRAMKHANHALVRVAERKSGSYQRAGLAAGLAAAALSPPPFQKWTTGNGSRRR
jgi:hypothetical protein